jgi:hypothetical protein
MSAGDEMPWMRSDRNGLFRSDRGMGATGVETGIATEVAAAGVTATGTGLGPAVIPGAGTR